MTKKVSIFEAFRRACMDHAKDSAKAQCQAFVAVVQSDPGYLVALAEDYFYRQHANWQPKELTPGSFTLAATPARAEQENKRAAQRAESRVRTEREYEKMRTRLRDVLLMSIYMPNGKMSGDCTGAELAKVGGFWAAIGKQVGPRNVMRKRVTEQEAHNIRERFFKDQIEAPTRRGDVAELRVGD